MSLALPMLHDRDRVNIVEPGRLHPAVSFARASTATYMGPAGTLLTAAVNAPRYEYDSAGNYLGLLIEDARTNLLKYSNDFTNAAWSKSAGGTGSAPVITPNYGTAPDGSMTAARVVFAEGASTTGSDFSLLQQTGTALPNVPTAVTVYARSTTGAAQKLYVDVAGTHLSQAVTLGATWVRVGVYSSTGASQRMDIGIRANIGVSTSDVMLAFAQLESGAFATSYIPTTSAAVTRSSDVESTALTALGISTTQGVFVVEHDTPSGRPVLYTGANKILDSAGGGKVAIAYDGSGVRISRNGAAITTGAAITWASTLDFNAGMNAHIKRLTWYRTKRADSELQRLTA